jgi:hypothetical protein
MGLQTSPSELLVLLTRVCLSGEPTLEISIDVVEKCVSLLLSSPKDEANLDSSLISVLSAAARILVHVWQSKATDKRPAAKTVLALCPSLIALVDTSTVRQVFLSFLLCAEL